jgi:hypothetical protein
MPFLHASIPFLSRQSWFVCLLVFGCLGATITFPTNSHAYLRSTSKDGKALFWANFPVPFHLNDAGTPNLPKEAVFDVLRASFETWTKPDCTCLRFSDQGLTSSAELGLDTNNLAANQNILLFQTKDWEYDTQVVAVTSTIYQKTDGRLLAFDMEMNNVGFTFSLDGKPIGNRSTMDLQNVVTHEVGHVLGLDHSTERNATMFDRGQPGETKKRELHQDDINGLCAIYPKDNGCVDTPPPSSGCGCQSTPSNGHFLSIFLLILSLFWILRRRKMSS